jgi:small conductance mechanosensitive channel
MYLSLFAFIILALNYLGISMSAILAAIATLGIAVSLGAQHFVSDIIAGLTMVFEGTVHVGDIVDIGAGGRTYHGEVREIGLRFIRILTHEGNIVALSNRDVNMTTNMMQLNSRCRCEFTISSEYPIEEIEEVLGRELPESGRNDRRIISGPDYQGILALEGGQMTLLITAECREQDITDVQLIINRSVQRIFTQNGYRI